jgi:hypothetical protein
MTKSINGFKLKKDIVFYKDQPCMVWEPAFFVENRAEDKIEYIWIKLLDLPENEESILLVNLKDITLVKLGNILYGKD